MEDEIRGITIQEISKNMGLEEIVVAEYIEGPLKGDIEMEKVRFGDGTYDPYIMDLILIQMEVDAAGERLEKQLQIVREAKSTSLLKEERKPIPNDRFRPFNKTCTRKDSGQEIKSGSKQN